MTVYTPDLERLRPHRLESRQDWGLLVHVGTRFVASRATRLMGFGAFGAMMRIRANGAIDNASPVQRWISAPLLVGFGKTVVPCASQSRLGRDGKGR